MITHTIDQFILNPKSILLTSSYQIPSQNKVKAEKLEKRTDGRTEEPVGECQNRHCVDRMKTKYVYTAEFWCKYSNYKKFTEIWH